MVLSFFDKVKKSVSDAAGTVSQTFSSAVETVSQMFTDTSHMSWEERVKYYSSLETADGYAEALRLTDLHMPGDEHLVEVWKDALEKHPELAFDIYNRALVTIKPAIWHKIHEIYTKILDCVTQEQKKGIKEVIALIEYRKLHDLDAGKSKLVIIYDYDPEKYEYDPEKMDLAAKGEWEFLESALNIIVKRSIVDQTEFSVKVGHALANYSDSVYEPERSIEFLKRYISQAGKDITLKWRLAIWYRDLSRWDDYITSLKDLGKCVEKLEDRIDICYEMIRIYCDVLKDAAKAEKIYRFILSLDPCEDGALNYLTTVYEQSQSWKDLISVLKNCADESTDNNKKSDIYLRIASVYQEHIPESAKKIIQYCEKSLLLNDKNQVAIDKLKPVYKKREEWDKLISLLDAEINIKDKTPEDKIAIYKEMAIIYRCKIIDDSKAENVYKQILKIVPNDDEAILFLTNQYKIRENWSALVIMLKNKANVDGNDDKFETYLKIAELYLNKLDSQSDAAEYYEKCLEIRPDYEDVINQLKKYYAERKDWKKLLAVNRKELDLLSDKDKQIALLKNMVNMASSNLKDDAAAIEMWGLILDREPKNEDALHNLEELKQKSSSNGNWDNYIAVLKKQVDLAESVDEQIKLLKQIACIANKLGDNGQVILMTNEILKRDPDNDIINALDRFSAQSGNANDADEPAFDDSILSEGLDIQTDNIMFKGLKYISGIHAYKERKKSIANKDVADKLKAEVESELKTKRDQLNGYLELFGHYRLEALHYSVGKFLNVLERLKRLYKENEYEFLKAVDVKENDIAEFKQIDMQATDALKTLAIGGGFAAIGLVGTPMLVTAGVTAFAAASTGTAISSLSGAAATNAVLAWLGGGSLAAGGGGMAAGAALLTGIAATSAASVAMVAVGSLASAFYAKKNTESEQYLAVVSKWAAESRRSMVAIDAIKKRVSEMLELTHNIEMRSAVLLARLEALIDTFDKTNDEHVLVFQQTALLIKSMSELAKTPILDEEGNINEAANIIAKETEKIINKDLI